MKKQFLFFVVCLLLAGFINAQTQLIVKLNNNNTETFTLSDIRSIKFGVANMNLYQKNGILNTWNLSDVANYSFKQATGVSDDFHAYAEDLQIFPNPVSESASITYSNKRSGRIRIEITDVSGKLIQLVYEGNHQGERTYNFNVNTPAGIYFCRITSNVKALTRSFIIQ